MLSKDDIQDLKDYLDEFVQWGTDIFYAILFCIITSFCFWSLWKALILTAKRFPSLVLICYRLIPIGIFCFTPFFFIAKSITTFFSPFIQSDHPLPGMCSLFRKAKLYCLDSHFHMVDWYSCQMYILCEGLYFIT